MAPTTTTTTPRLGLFLDGRTDRDDRRATAAVHAPYDGQRLFDVEQADEADVDRAVRSAHRAYSDHRRTAGHERARWLHAAGDAIAAVQDELVDLLVTTLGKPRVASEFEARRGPDLLHRCAEEIGRFGGANLPLDGTSGGEGRWGITRREPFGVVGAITPFNAPVNLMLQKVGPALAAGNAVVVKPAPEGAVVSLRVGELVAANVPAGLVHVLPGDAATALALSRHPLVRAVSLTGGVAAGEAVLAASGVKPVLLELGSNAPNLVCADADLDDAAARIATAAFGASGQQCISAQRVIVEQPVLDPFLERFVAAASKLRVGDPADPATDLGPVVHERARARVLRHLDDALSRGARLALDGRSDTLLLGPSIVVGAPTDALVLREEVFGPVAVVVAAADLDHALAIANDSELGLQAACFTRSLANAMRAGEELRAGSVWINESTRFRLDTYPFGGYGRSGIGREGVRDAMEALSQVKFIGLRGV
jgi:acyl-CoA reductase-like NAD-dependent aldehyde dehydrogenase